MHRLLPFLRAALPALLLHLPVHAVGAAPAPVVRLAPEQAKVLFGTMEGGDRVAALYQAIHIEANSISWGKGTPQQCTTTWTVASAGDSGDIPEQVALPGEKPYWIVKLKLAPKRCRAAKSYIQFAFEKPAGGRVEIVTWDRRGQRQESFHMYKDYAFD